MSPDRKTAGKGARGVDVKIDDHTLRHKGPKGELRVHVPRERQREAEDGRWSSPARTTRRRTVRSTV